MKKKIINGLLFAVVLVAATSSFVSCKDYDGYNELQEKYLTLQDAFNKQVKAMEDFVLTSKYNQEVGANYDKAKGTIKDRLDEIEKDLDPNVPGSLAEQVVKNEQTILYVTALAKADSARSWNDSIRIDNLVSAMTNAWGDNLAEAMQKAAKVAATVAADSDAWNKAVEVADSAWNWIKSGKDAKDLEYKNLAEMIKDFKDADKALEDQINALKQDVDNILATLQKEVTGITIQGTYNPIFGSFAYPIDVQSNILATYYGEVINAGELGYEFPAGDEFEDVWASGKPAILDSELEAISPKNVYTVKDGILMVEGKGNAGKLYLTVNPSNVDFEKASFTLRASDNTISKVQLSPLEASTEQLKWGYNRAAAENSPNGFYVATAEIKKESVKDVTLNFNLKGIASDVQSIMQDWSKTSAADIAKLALKVVEGMKTDAPRLGVQYQWKDATSTNPWKNYVSKYDLAAVSVKPLGFDFLNDAHYHEGIVKFKNKLTAKEKAFEMELINEIAQMIVVNIPWPNVVTTVPTLDGVYTIQEADGKMHVHIKATANFSGATASKTVYITAGSIYTNQGGTDPVPSLPSTSVPITIPAISVSGTAPVDLDITEVYATIKNSIENTINGLNDNISSTIDKYMNKLINAQNKVFNKVISVAKNPNRYLQPALIGKCNQFNGFFYPSRDFLAPTQIKQGQKIMFYPTTLTGETVVPAFKKYVAISGVWKVSDISSTDDAKAANAAAGEYLNTVFDGAQFNIQNGFEINTGELKAGYVYEFIYECLGYNGKVAGKKYYIEVYE